MDIVAFTDEHLDGAAALLAERHARHREAEPALPDTVDFREQIERELVDGDGVAALADGELVGYLVGRRRQDQVGPHVWSYIAGHAVREPEVARDLYAAAAARWVEAGLRRHFVYVPALSELVDPWFRLSFGASAALAVRETAPAEPFEVGVAIRESSPDDTWAALLLERHMVESMLPSPSFSYHAPDDEVTAAEEWAETWVETDTYRHFVAERGGRIVGHVLLYRRPHDLRVPADSIDLAAASTEPSERGTGVGHRADTLRHRLGARARIPDDDHRLADDEPARLPLLAAPRLPRDLPPALPLHSVVPRIPLLSGSRLLIVSAPDDAVVLTPPAPPQSTIVDVPTAVREALRFPLQGPALDRLVTRGGRVTIVVEQADAPAARGAGRSAPAGDLGHGRRAATARRARREADDPRRLRPRPTAPP